MLAGCSSTLLSPRNHRQPCHFQLQEKMGTQRLDLPCAFTRKDGPRVAISLEKPVDARTTAACSFRQQQNPITPTSLSSHNLASSLAAVPWEAMVVEADGAVGGGSAWERKPKSSVKRFYHDRSFLDDDDEDDDDDTSCYSRQTKRIKKGTSNNNNSSNSSSYEHQLVVGAADSNIWFPHFLREEEESSSIITFPNNAFGKLVPDDREKSLLAGTTASGGSIQRIRSGPSSSNPGSHCSSPNGREQQEEEEEEDSAGNGSHPLPFHSSGERAAAAAVTGEEEEGSSITEHHRGLELMSLLMACLESVCTRNYAGTNYFLARLGELASPEGGSSTIHRIVAYFTEALVLRVAKLWPNVFSVTPPLEISGGRDRVDDEDDNNNNNMALCLLNHISPIPKFLHFSMNQMLLRAFEGKDRVHIIDFDIKQGLQWPSLFQSLASRPSPPSHVRITGIGSSKRELQETGARLAGLAESLSLPFQFHAVVDRFEDVRFWMLHVKGSECVAVNCVGQLHKALYDDDGRGSLLMELLALIRSTNPAIVLVAEQEAEHNDPRWEARLVSSLPYYAAIFDSIDACLPPLSSLARRKIEQMFAREIRNIVACEGHERLERHQSFAKWRRLLEEEERGVPLFRPVRFEEGGEMMLQSRILLRMYSGESYYSVVMQGEDNAGLTLKWLDQPLYTVSAWEPLHVVAEATTTTTSTSHQDS